MELKTGVLLHNGIYRILGTLGQGGFGITYLALLRPEEFRLLIFGSSAADYAGSLEPFALFRGIEYCHIGRQNRLQ